MKSAAFCNKQVYIYELHFVTSKSYSTEAALSSVCASDQPVFELRMMANKWHIFTISNGKYQVNMLLLGFVRTRVLMSRSRLNNGATHGG